MDSKTFDSAYWLSKAPEVRAAFNQNREGQDIDTRTAAAQGLLKRGYVIDREIMIWDWEPFLVMTWRTLQGFTWVPNAVQPSPFWGAGAPAYDPNDPPAGSIKVSLDLGDYPAFDPPAPVVPSQPQTSFVGQYLANGFYTSLPGNPAKEGDETTKDGIVYVLHTYPFGGWYTKKD